MESSSPSNQIANISPAIQNTQELSLPGIEVSVFSRFGFAVFVFSICIWVLLWSRNQVQQTKVALGQAQTQLDRAIKQQQLLELELNTLLSPSAIEKQVISWELQPTTHVIDIVESP